MRDLGGFIDFAELSRDDKSPLFLAIPAILKLYQTGANHIDPSPYNIFLEEATGHFDYMLDNLTEQELKVIKLVAVEDIIPKKFDPVIRNLAKRGIVTSTVERSRLFSYLLENYVLQKFMLKSKAKERRFLGLNT